LFVQIYNTIDGYSVGFQDKTLKILSGKKLFLERNFTRPIQIVAQYVKTTNFLCWEKLNYRWFRALFKGGAVGQSERMSAEIRRVCPDTAENRPRFRSASYFD